MCHSEQKRAHFCSEWYSVGCGTGFAGFVRSIRSVNYNQWHTAVMNDGRRLDHNWKQQIGKCHSVKIWHQCKSIKLDTKCENRYIFLAATKQLYDWFSPSVRPSVCLSVRLSHLFHHVPIIVSSWNFQELLPRSEVMSTQRSKVKVTEVNTQLSRFRL